MTIPQLEAQLAARGVKSFKTVYAAGLWLAICPRAVGIGGTLEVAISHMVSIIERAPVRVLDAARHDITVS